jgi:Phage integrase family
MRRNWSESTCLKMTRETIRSFCIAPKPACRYRSSSLLMLLMSYGRCPMTIPAIFFWSGNGDPRSARKAFQRSFWKLFRLANIRREDGSQKRCHPHMFRDTFAVELLLAGNPIDQVSLLLGHSSVKITERHYAPFCKARQQQLAAAVKRSWGIREPRACATRHSQAGPTSPSTTMIQ